MNNYEKIKKMTIDEMAEFLIVDHGICADCVAFKICYGGLYGQGSCYQRIKQWLESEAE